VRARQSATHGGRRQREPRRSKAVAAARPPAQTTRRDYAWPILKRTAAFTRKSGHLSLRQMLYPTELRAQPVYLE
jgi:hypothetical protein